MMRSLYSGITGLRNHQTRMDVIGNNIANVNTAGFKSSRTVFQDLYSQTLGSGSANTFDGTTGRGGTNPQQIGLGVTLSTIDILFTPGAAQYTGRPLDVMINNDGFFCIGEGTQELYTRAGNFYEDDKHFLVTNSGGFVRGFAVVDTNGVLSAGTEMNQIELNPAYENFSIGDNGLITAYDPAANGGAGGIVNVAFIKMATFPNTNGLEKTGGNYYRVTASSGAASYSIPGDKGAGLLKASSLEMSNVDLAAEFVDLIVTQRGFQANSRTITTSDQMLEELVNLKR